MSGYASWAQTTPMSTVPLTLRISASALLYVVSKTDFTLWLFLLKPSKGQIMIDRPENVLREYEESLR